MRHERRLPVDPLAMADREHGHQHRRLLDLVDHAVVPDPEAAPVSASQLAALRRPGVSGEVVYRPPDALCVLWPDSPGEGLLGGPLDADLVPHSSWASPEPTLSRTDSQGTYSASPRPWRALASS